MRRALAAAAVLAATLVLDGPAGAAVGASAGRPVFHGTISRIDPALADRHA